MLDIVILKPLAILLSVLLLASGVANIFQKFEINHLTSRNTTLEQAEKRRVELAASALRDNAAKEATDKKRSVTLENKNVNANKAVSVAKSANLKLLNDIMRDSTRRDTVSQTCPDTSLDTRAAASPIFGGCSKLLIDLASEADKLRNQMMTCQQYVGGL